MFCPKCGKPDQTPETFCRQCGVFLPDFSKPGKPKNTPEEHVKVNTVLSALTIVASFTLAILLYTMLAFRPETHPLIYVTAGLLIAIGVWHIQTLYRILQLRKHFKNKKRESVEARQIEGPQTRKFFNETDPGHAVPLSITEHTTTKLSEKVPR